jgi:hypothetical protein
MVQIAAHLGDLVLPLRRKVLFVPRPLRHFFRDTTAL